MALNLFKKKAKPESGAPVTHLKAFPTKAEESIYKSYIPDFLYKPPFGYPRYVNIPYIRQLASSPFVEMCVSTIINEITSLKWDIVPVQEGQDGLDEIRKEVKEFFENPNANKERLEDILRKLIRDILEIDSGVINKIFDRMGNLKEIMVRDGSTFTKNPDIHGVIGERDDFILDENVGDGDTEKERIESQERVKERAAYFQYGFYASRMYKPVPFGKREVIWFEQNPRPDQRYGRSYVQVLAESLQTLIYSIEHNLEYFNENSIPKGVIGLEGASDKQVENFKKQWKEQQKTQDKFGNTRSIFHHVPVIGNNPKFEKIQFDNNELQLIDQQKWFSKMVWAVFGVTPSELGYTEDSNKATEIIQSRVFKRKAINPLLRLIEEKFNKEIISEFGYDDKVKFQFDTFDVNEEINKADLYSRWVKNGIRTVNEVRTQFEGLEEIEWGDEPPKQFRDSNPMEQSENEEVSETEEKAMTTEEEGRDENDKNPLVLGENEKPSKKKLEKAIKYWLREKRKKVIELLERDTKPRPEKQIKSIDDVKDNLETVMGAEALREITQQTVKGLFEESRQNLEKQMNMNFVPQQSAVDYLQNHVFSNIKDMTEEIANDVRAELERGFINGESVNEMKKRVKKSFTENENRAEAIARSETTRASNQGELQSLRSSGKNFKKEWVSKMDDRTSSICRRLHGQKVDLNDDFEDSQTGWRGKSPPSHVNCRSTMVYEPVD